jgi:hypothetical protein
MPHDPTAVETVSTPSPRRIPAAWLSERPPPPPLRARPCRRPCRQATILVLLEDGPATQKRIEIALLGTPEAAGNAVVHKELIALLGAGALVRERRSTGNRPWLYRLNPSP